LSLGVSPSFKMTLGSAILLSILQSSSNYFKIAATLSVM
jgi:hypothetical protein